jgi:hypothetical protein
MKEVCGVCGACVPALVLFAQCSFVDSTPLLFLPLPSLPRLLTCTELHLTTRAPPRPGHSRSLASLFGAPRTLDRDECRVCVCVRVCFGAHRRCARRPKPVKIKSKSSRFA